MSDHIDDCFPFEGVSEDYERDRLISLIADVLTNDFEAEAIHPEEGRRRGYTGVCLHRGCKSEEAICPASEWASCQCFIQACAIVDALQ